MDRLFLSEVYKFPGIVYRFRKKGGINSKTIDNTITRYRKTIGPSISPVKPKNISSAEARQLLRGSGVRIWGQTRWPHNKKSI
jgi:hypothetical protein